MKNVNVSISTLKWHGFRLKPESLNWFRKGLNAPWTIYPCHSFCRLGPNDLGHFPVWIPLSNSRIIAFYVSKNTKRNLNFRCLGVLWIILQIHFQIFGLEVVFCHFFDILGLLKYHCWIFCLQLFSFEYLIVENNFLICYRP